MLSSILNYLEGSVTLLSDSNAATIRLSDGGVFNATDFNAMAKTVSILLSRASDKEQDITALQDPYEPAQAILPINPTVSMPVPGRYDTRKSPLYITFGKYRGKRLCDIEDENWLDWLYKSVQLRVEDGKLFTVKTPAAV
jgi:hypothetical protein